MSELIEIRFHGDFPEWEWAREEIERLLRKYARFAYRQVTYWNVEYDPNEDGEAAIKVSRRYRYATLVVRPGYFATKAKEREQVIAHEVAHALTVPILDAAACLVEHFVPEEAKEYAMEQVVQAVEATTEDLALALVQAATSQGSLEGCPDSLSLDGKGGEA